jgi:hypothetical protein
MKYITTELPSRKITPSTTHYPTLLLKMLRETIEPMNEYWQGKKFRERMRHLFIQDEIIG